MLTETTILDFVNNIQGALWSGPLLVILLGVGIYQTWQTKAIQLSHLLYSFKLIFCPSDEDGSGDISPFESLMTALAGAIGTGNIAGIATAIATGGFGALFWMWIMAFFGMATAYSETVLSVKYRKKNENGTMSGGPMYSLLYGLKSPKLAAMYAVLAAISALGIGCMVQANSVVDAITTVYSGERLHIGIILAITTGIAIIGGVKSIGKIAGVLVPFMAFVYLACGIFVLCWHHEHLGSAFSLILSSAFTGQAAVGGFIGSSIMVAMQTGAQYGIFANEAGLGSMSIAAASAKTECPVEQGMRSMGGVFFATIIVCTITGLVIAVSNVLGTTAADGSILIGSSLAMAAFSTVHSSFNYVVLFGLIFFAFTTMLAWAYYGEKCFEFMFGLRSVHLYRWLFTFMVVVGAVMRVDMAWAFANLASALMAFPNLLSIVFLSRSIREETEKYVASTSLQNGMYRYLPRRP